MPADSNLTDAQRKILAELAEAEARLLDVLKKARELLELHESVCAQCYDPDYPCPGFKGSGQTCTRPSCRHHLAQHLLS